MTVGSAVSLEKLNATLRLVGANSFLKRTILARQILAITQEPKNLADALAIAKQVLAGDGQRFWLLKTAYILLGLDPKHFHRVQARWVAAGRPHLKEFAPYTAHCLLVEVFFNVAIGKKLISPDRVSNRVDMAYLFYLPFSMIFVSNDKLHQRTAPLFLTDKQMFVMGADLKNDLASLDYRYSALPDEEKSEGLFRIASYPPDDDSCLTTRVWKQLGMNIQPKPTRNSNSPSAAELLASVKQMREATQRRDRATRFSQSELDDPSHVVIERMVPLQRGNGGSCLLVWKRQKSDTWLLRDISACDQLECLSLESGP